MLWKVAGTLEKPNYITVASKRPRLVINFDANIVVPLPQVNFGKD